MLVCVLVLVISVCNCVCHFAVPYSVGEEDEVSIRDVAFMVAEAMEFKGEVQVHTHMVPVCVSIQCVLVLL